MNQCWGATEQVFEVHSPVIADDGAPKVEWVNERADDQSLLVYFAIKGKPYLFVIVVMKEEDGFAVGGAYAEAKVRVYLGSTVKA